MTRQIEQAMEQDLEQLDVDGRRRPRSRRWRNCTPWSNKIGYPDKWRDYSSVDDHAAMTSWATCSARRVFESHRQLAKIGKPRGPRGVGHDAAHGERLLRPADERHQLPGRRAAAAAVRHQDGRRAELRQHRRRPSATSSPTASTTKAASSTPKAICRTGGPRTTLQQFEQRAECVVDQYAQYTIVDDIKINGKLTLGEDVADLGGTLLAYMAWKAATKGKKLTAVDGFTPDQRFFIGIGAVGLRERAAGESTRRARSPIRTRRANTASMAWCRTCRSSSRRLAAKPDQPMVRENRCRVW